MKRLMKCFLLLMTLAAVASIQTSCSNGNGGSKPSIEAGNVRHVILWTISPDLSREEKMEVISLAESSMERFVKEFDGLIKADVIHEKRLESSNCDFMFDMYFKDAKALEDFSTSPEHLAVVASLKPYMTGRSCLDIELQH